MSLNLNYKAAVESLENLHHFHFLDLYMYTHVQRKVNRKWGWFGAFLRKMQGGTHASAPWLIASLSLCGSNALFSGFMCIFGHSVQFAAFHVFSHLYVKQRKKTMRVNFTATFLKTAQAKIRPETCFRTEMRRAI